MKITLHRAETVIICGPFASGRTTLFNKIRKENPYEGSICLSLMEVVKCLKAKGVNNSLNVAQHFFLVQMKMTVECIQKGTLFVLHNCYCEEDAIDKTLELYYEAKKARPVHLIKMNPKLSLQREFLMRYDSAERVAEEELLRQREQFRDVVLRDFAEKYSNVIEDTINDPTTLEIEYL